MASKRKKRLNAACRAGQTLQQRYVTARQKMNTQRFLAGSIFDPARVFDPIFPNLRISAPSIESEADDE
jgi:hypothetical protein